MIGYCRLGWLVLTLCWLGGYAVAQEPPPLPPAPVLPLPPEEPPTNAPLAAPDTSTAVLELRLRALEEEVRKFHAPPGLVPLPPSSEPQTQTFEARWRNAFVIQSHDELFRLRIGALLQADGRAFIDRPDPPAADAVNQFLLRRARLDLEADAWRYFGLRIQTDFAGGKVVIFDAYADVKLRPELRLRVGKFKVPFGLERLQPAASLVLVERAAPTEIAPNRDLGVQLSGDVGGAVLSYAVGLFNGNVDNSTIDAELDDDKEVAARLFLQPFRLLPIASLHNLGLGGAFTYGTQNGKVASPGLPTIRSFGQSQIFSFFSGTTVADTVTTAGPRLRWTAHGAYYFWRLGLLGEYVDASYSVQKANNSASLHFRAWQAAATFLLTDDEAAYTGVVPRRPFAPWQGRWGAFELAFRYSGLQIDDATFTGGLADRDKSVRAAQTFVVGANWYTTANTRFMVDYARTNFSAGAPAGDRAPENVVVGRMQFAL